MFAYRAMRCLQYKIHNGAVVRFLRDMDRRETGKKETEERETEKWETEIQ